MKKFLSSIALSGMLLTNLSLFADLPEPYASVHDLPSTPYYVIDGYVFYALASAHQSAVIIDVESLDGSVARSFAQSVGGLPFITKIYSVSSWLSADSSQKHLFQKFLSNVKHENSAELITPIRMNSQEAAGALNVTADFISITGGNDQNGIYNDILAWFTHLSNDGVICGNNWFENSVQIGVTRAAAVLDVAVKTNGNVWYIEKQTN
jgi:hypothetical protein